MVVSSSSVLASSATQTEEKDLSKIKSYIQTKQDELAALKAAEEAAAEATAAEEAHYDYTDYSYSYSYSGGYSGGSTVTSLSDLLNGQGRAVDGNGTSYTYYNHDLGYGALDIPGENFDSNGVSYDGDGYIVVASSDYGKGTVLDTPYGEAKVYDTGCASGTVDIYTNR